MNFDQLIAKFNQGIHWNLYFYLIYKISSTIVTFSLFKHLDTQHFAALINSYSVIYLILLWLDFGFRKSLPRYSPEFLSCQQTQPFLRDIIIFQIIALSLALPLMIILSYHITRIFGIAGVYAFYAIPLIFALEGMVSIVRIMHYSYFLHKSFNILAATVITFESLINLALALSLKNSTTLLQSIFLTKIAANSILLSCSIYMLKHAYELQEPSAEHYTTNYYVLKKEFIKHSAIMWGTTTLRSFSERNFLIPLLAIIAGAPAANIFKIANDGALLFQRIILKTIGTTDTSLLAYAGTLPEKKNLTNVAFQKLSTKIIALCLPLLGVIGLFIAVAPQSLKISYGFQAFSIMAFSYLIESMLLPFERLLEVKRKYLYLVGVYIFYFVLLCVLLIMLLVSWIGLGYFIFLVCVVRLVSLLIMARASYLTFRLAIPYQSYVPLTAKTISITLCAYILLLRVPCMRSGFHALVRVVMKSS